MKLTKRVYQGSGGSSMQDLEMEISVQWTEIEIKKVPITVRNAIEAVIHFD